MEVPETVRRPMAIEFALPLLIKLKEESFSLFLPDVLELPIDGDATRPLGVTLRMDLFAISASSAEVTVSPSSASSP